ncbi:MAG: S8 family serine peptidase [Deltaproteobacteria bacterium]|nr:S8 family serine peptidase [Deltaproteobacteria bacterium]
MQPHFFHPVLSDSGSGSFGDVLAGMYYAADIGCEVANMSLGASFPLSADNGPNRLTGAMTQAAIYARSHGTTIIAAAGNDSTNFNQTADLVHLPSSLSQVTSISATAPRGFYAVGGSDVDYLASYSNYGSQGIDFSAPGGDWVYPGNELCTVVISRPCWVLDFVFSTGNGGWYWSVGTSMASPHAAGVAALIISETGDSTPARVQAELRARALDLGMPGRDHVHGRGAVNSGH